MPRFFVENDKIDLISGTVTLTGENASHISLSLRMRIGETITVCDSSNQFDYVCEICGITKDGVTARIITSGQNNSEPDVCVTLFQALPKGDKMELVIQKSVELGVHEIVPVITDRCVSRPDEKSLARKLGRWNKISLEAAMQSGRGRVPRVSEPVSFEDAVSRIRQADIGFLCYEKQQGSSLNSIISNKNAHSIAFFVGPEGGISEHDAEYARDRGVTLVGLGERILRTETAPLCVLSGIMFLTDNMN